MKDSDEKMLLAIKVLKELGKEPTARLLVETSEKGELNIVKLCIDAGVDVNTMVENKWLALNLACQNGHLEIVKLLIDSGADINRIDKNSNEMGKGFTPMALATSKKDLEIIKLLLEKGADINKLDDYDQPPIMQTYIVKDEKTRKFLLENGATDLDDNQMKRVEGKPVLAVSFVIILILAVIGAIAYFSSSSSNSSSPAKNNPNCSSSQAEEFMVRTLENKGWTIENVRLQDAREEKCDYLFRVFIVGFGCKLIEIKKTGNGYECIDIQDY